MKTGIPFTNTVLDPHRHYTAKEVVDLFGLDMERALTFGAMTPLFAPPDATGGNGEPLWLGHALIGAVVAGLPRNWWPPSVTQLPRWPEGYLKHRP